MTEIDHGMLPPPWLCMRMLPGEPAMAPPAATALIKMGEASTKSRGARVTGTAQSPNNWQSLCIATAANRGTGAVTEAVSTAETGASAMVSWATAGGVRRGSVM